MEVVIDDLSDGYTCTHAIAMLQFQGTRHALFAVYFDDRCYGNNLDAKPASYSVVNQYVMYTVCLIRYVTNV